jgi:hypothetical protein
MRPTPRGTHLWSGLALGALLVLAACSSDSTAPGSPELSAAASADAGAASQDEMEQATESFTVQGALDPAATSFAAAPVPGASPAFAAPFLQNCASLSSITDTDNDGAPDNAIFTFALPACHFENFRGGTLDLTGTVTVSDPTPTAADFAWHAVLADFTFKATNTQLESFTAVRNGTRDLTGNASGLTLANNITTVRTASGHPSVQVTHNLQLNFTPTGSLAQGQPLPSGTITSTGTLTFVRGSESRTFTVTTPTPLQYDASCSGPRRARIKAGEVRWTLPSGAYVSVVWSACGTRPTRTFVPAA